MISSLGLFSVLAHYQRNLLLFSFLRILTFVVAQKVPHPLSFVSLSLLLTLYDLIPLPYYFGLFFKALFKGHIFRVHGYSLSLTFAIKYTTYHLCYIRCIKHFKPTLLITLIEKNKQKHAIIFQPALSTPY